MTTAAQAPGPTSSRHRSSEPAGLAPRRAALRLLHGVTALGRPLETGFDAACAGLSGPDRGLVRAITIAALRWLVDLDAPARVLHAGSRPCLGCRAEPHLHRRPAHPDAHGPGRRPLRQTFPGIAKLKSQPPSPTPHLLRGLRLLRLASLFLRGALTVLLIYPWSPDRRRMALKQRWSADILKALNIRLEADLAALPPASLVVANHISWLDIFVINAAFPAAFVSKAEVLQWPLIGW
ncbi:MAG: 1-acyl-sn-glycerol-3-phosphate acyltransferase, partial [Sphingomonadaceae bacterium]